MCTTTVRSHTPEPHSPPRGGEWGWERPPSDLRIYSPETGSFLQADRRPAFQAVPAVHLAQLCALSLGFAQRCRPEVGVPSCPRASSGSALRALRPSGPRADRRSAFQAVPAVHLAQLSALCGPPGCVPTRGRRSKPSPRFFWLSSARFRWASPSGADRRSAFQAVPALLLAQLYALCGPPGRVPAGGRRSKPSPRFIWLSSTRFAALRGGAGQRSAFQAVPALLLGLRRPPPH